MLRDSAVLRLRQPDAIDDPLSELAAKAPGECLRRL